MVSKYTLWVVLLLGSIVTATAQTAPSKKTCSCGFSSINQVGLLTGEKGNVLQVQSVNGFRYKTWFIGAGIGLDAYERLSYPVFLDLRKNLWAGDKNIVPYFYADGGYAFIVDKTGYKDNNFTINKYVDGLYYDIGLGVRMPVKKNAFLLSIGQSMRNMERKDYTNVAMAGYSCAGVNCDGFRGVYKYRLNRLSLKLGFQF